jgi:hypothetical protein
MGGKHTPDQIGIRRLCTIKEISEAAEVGVGTVHRVLKGRPVSEANRQKVGMAIRALNEAAMGLATCERLDNPCDCKP